AAADDARQVYKVGLNSTRLLLSIGDVLIGWLLLRGAEAALRALDEAGTGQGPAGGHQGTAFYQGKVAAGRWFAANVLPELKARRAVAESTGLGLMDLPAEAF
ncbi:acyl-CoA dehydrogenase C-terminal domain-containing protein, partial [Frankia sp. AvcI1]